MFKAETGVLAVRDSMPVSIPSCNHIKCNNIKFFLSFSGKCYDKWHAIAGRGRLLNYKFSYL